MEETTDSFDSTHGMLSKQDILNGNQLAIIQHYVPTLHMGLQKSPFNPTDKRESFSVYVKVGRLWYKDHGDGGTRPGDVFDFVKEWYLMFRGIDLGFREIVRTIEYDMKLQPGETYNKELFFHDSETGHKHHRGKGEFKLQIKDEGWTSWALNYWEGRYGIWEGNLDTLFIGHAKEVWATKPPKPTFLWGISTEHSPKFYIYFPRTKKAKCYAPFERGKKKWTNSAGNDQDIMGYDRLHIKQRKPDIIMFTKAFKEIAFYVSLGIDSLAIHGEGQLFPPDFIRHIKKYSKFQFSLYDNDWAGRKAAVRLWRAYGIPPFFIKEAKNVTDLWEKNPLLLDKYADLYVQLKDRI